MRLTCIALLADKDGLDLGRLPSSVKAVLGYSLKNQVEGHANTDKSFQIAFPESIVDAVLNTHEC